MSRKIKPIVVVSECLGIASCRWDGDRLDSEFVRRIKSHCHLKPICPELRIGMGVPREPVRIVHSNDRLILSQPSTGKELTAQMHQFCREYLASLKEVDGFILKNRSPSCGIRDTRIYKSVTAKRYYRRNSGLFALNVKRAFPALPIEDELRLENRDLRDHFLTKLFTIASFRTAAKSHDLAALSRFHRRNQLLFDVYNRTESRILGLVIAAIKINPAPMLWSEYERHLHYLLTRRARYTSSARVMDYLLGRVPPIVNGSDRREARRKTNRFLETHSDLPGTRTALRRLVLRAKDKRLLEQTWLAPYPAELAE